MRILLAVILTLSLGLVSSCTPSAGIVVEASKLYINNPDASTVTVMRKPQLTGAAVTVGLALDHEVIAYLGPGDRVEFQVQPGEHYVAVILRNVLGHEAEVFTNFNAKANKKYYFYYSMNLMSEETFRLKELTPQEGEKELAKNKYELLTAGK